MANPLTWLRDRFVAAEAIALAPDLAKAAPDFQVPPGGQLVSNALLAQFAKQQKDFGVSGPNAAGFGPSAPPLPEPLDDTQTPRAFQYRVGWNQPGLPGEGRPVDMQTVRELSRTYDILRKAIEIRKDELCAMRFDVIARDTDRRKARQVIKEQQDTIERIRAFFANPCPGRTWQSWLRRLLEEYFVTDSVSVWKWRTFGGKLIGLRLIDGTLIKPLLTIEGDTPTPPDWAYQQYYDGVARYSFTADELLYTPKNTSVDRVYGFSPVEQFIMHITEALRFRRYNLDFFTDGTLPEGVAEAPATWTAKQIEEFNVYWKAMLAGDTRALHQLQFVPAGFNFHEFKPWKFDKEYARWLVGVTAAALDVTAAELGFEPQNSGLGGKGFVEGEERTLKRKSTGPLTRWLLDELINPIIWTEFQAPHLQGTLIDLDEEDEQVEAMTARDLAIRNGSLSIDQAVEEDGGEPPGIGRIFVFGNTVLFEPDLIQGSLGGAASIKQPEAPKADDGTPDDDPDGDNTGSAQVKADLQDSHGDAKDAQSASKPGQGAEAKKAAEAGYDYSSTQVELPDDVANLVRVIGRLIPDEDLSAGGREDKPHITVKYGLHTDDASDVRRVLAGEGPITATLGQSSIFAGGPTSEYDVVMLDIESPDLERLNRKIAELPHTDTHPTYHPHVTIAYVKKGLGEKYAGENLLTGRTVVFDAVTFSGKSKQKVSIPLRVDEATKAAEVKRFLRFVEKRREDGAWRDFASTVLPGGVLTDLNKAAKAGASTEELRALVGLDAQPTAFKERVGATESAYRGLTTTLARRVGEAIEERVS